MGADGGGAGPPAEVAAPLTLRAPVAVTADEEANRLAVPLRAVASLPIEDLRFEFDSSFLLPDATRVLERLPGLRTQFPGAPVTLFGHTDRVGDDAYNKSLSARRVRSVYAVLVRDKEIWEDLYQHPLGGDEWRGRPVQYMLEALDCDPGPIDGDLGNMTKAAIKKFQTGQELPATGNLNPTTRDALFGAYMDAICQNTGQQPFQLQTIDFLGRGRDADGKVDYQGCSEFNPLFVPSKAQANATSAPAQRNRRDYMNASNRRVTLFLIAPGVEVKADEWPCPRANEGVAACRQRFWSDGATRLQPGPQPRRQRETHDTYACRFYERLTLTAEPGEVEAVRAGTVRARWSKDQVFPLHNDSFPPATPPTDVVPDDAKVELLADTLGVADGTPARIELRYAANDAAVDEGIIENLEVRGDQIIDPATGARPVFSFEARHKPWEIWDKPLFYMVAHVGDALQGESPHDLSTETDLLRVRPLVTIIADAIADTPAGGGLSTVDEMNEIGNLEKLDPARGVYGVPFNQAVVPIALWGSVIRNTYAYHQTSHGDVRCRVDGDQFNSTADGKQPTVCPNDPTHPGRSVLFIGDTPIGDAETNSVADVPSVPRYLIYINTCVAGFEPSFADALIGRGTQSVIAFQNYIPDDDAREMARQFFRKWTQVYRNDPEKIGQVYLSVSPAFIVSMRPIIFGGGAGGVAAAGNAVAGALGALA